MAAPKLPPPLGIGRLVAPLGIPELTLLNYARMELCDGGGFAAFVNAVMNWGVAWDWKCRPEGDMVYWFLIWCLEPSNL